MNDIKIPQTRLFVECSFMVNEVQDWDKPIVNNKLYTYISTFPVALGDYCVVVVSGIPKIVQVVSAGGKNRSALPEEELKYLVSQVDFGVWLYREERKRQLTAELEELKDLARKRAHKKAFMDAFKDEPDLQARLKAVLDEQSELG